MQPKFIEEDNEKETIESMKINFSFSFITAISDALSYFFINREEFTEQNETLTDIFNSFIDSVPSTKLSLHSGILSTLRRAPFKKEILIVYEENSWRNAS